MAKETIFIIEDEKNIVELVTFSLQKEGFRVASSHSGDEGLQMVRQKKPDLIILDLMLPKLDGLEICKILKNNDSTSHIPIIMMTAKSEEADRILGLEIGADDYVTKPFSPREMVARVKAVLRRVLEKPKHRVLKAGDLIIDLEKHLVSYKKTPINLSSKEYRLLQTLMEAEGRVLSRDFLLEHVWDYEKQADIETRTVDMHILQLRKKLQAESKRIVTIKGVGYRFDYD